MSVLSAQSIREFITIKPFTERQVHDNGMSYGLSVCGYDLRIRGAIDVYPGDFVLVTTEEFIELPKDVQGLVVDKSTLARRGISMLNTKFEPGWKGYPTIEIKNLGNEVVSFAAGAPLCQMEFHWLDNPTETPYTGKYQNQEQEAVGARYE